MTDVMDTQFYPVGKAKRITLTVLVGDGQQGGSAATLDGTPLQGTPEGDQTRFEVAADSLNSKLLRCVTTVKDVNPKTDQTSVTHHLRGGTSDKKFPYRKVVATKGQATYIITFALV